MTRSHPARYSPEVIAVLVTLIHPGEHIHDPFAGDGVRLGTLCDRVGAIFTGTDCEAGDWSEHDPRVARGDSRDVLTYPSSPFTICTSPVYTNGISSDYKEGPTSATKLRGRLSYGISLGHPLHPANLARTVVRSRPDKGASDYYPGHAEVVKHWDDRVIVNVDEPMGDDWCSLLVSFGYGVDRVIPVHTQRYRNGANAEVRADHEVIIVARLPIPSIAPATEG
jgi:hypothetical protein